MAGIQIDGVNNKIDFDDCANLLADLAKFCLSLAFLTILTIGFWLMIFLVSFIPYWIGGALYENWKLKREAKRQEEETL